MSEAECLLHGCPGASVTCQLSSKCLLWCINCQLFLWKFMAAINCDNLSSKSQFSGEKEALTFLLTKTSSTLVVWGHSDTLYCKWWRWNTKLFPSLLKFWNASSKHSLKTSHFLWIHVLSWEKQSLQCKNLTAGKTYMCQITVKWNNVTYTIILLIALHIYI